MHDGKREGSGEVEVRELRVPGEAAGERLDAWLAHRLGVGRRTIRRALEEGRVRLDAGAARKGLRLRGGERIRWLGPLPARDFEPLPSEGLAERLRILHRDAWLLAVDKPAGVPCHPLRADEPETILGAVRLLDPEAATAGPRRAEGGLLHRLDTETSGVLLFARSPEAFARLAPLVRGGEATKRYRAVTVGAPSTPSVLRFPLAAHPSDPSRVVACAPYGPAERWRGRPVPCESRLLEAEPHGPWALLTAELRQGWRHQLRVHLAAAGHPIVGDAHYGGPRPPGLERHLLHAEAVRLPHPEGRPPWKLHAPLPPDFAHWLAVGPGGTEEQGETP